MVQPSIVYETITFTGMVFDPLVNDGEYLNEAADFTVKFQCSGFVVNSAGWIATAGHCVDMENGKRALAEQAAQWAIDTDFYVEDYSVKELADSYRVDLWDAESETVKKNTASRGVEVSWSQTVSGATVEKRAPARVIGAQKFELGDAALLKVEAQGLNALPLADAETPAINSDVVTVGYPAVIASYTDYDLVPTFNPGTISSTKTVAQGLLSVLQLSAGMSGGMSGGPTVNLNGEVVGINSSGYDGETINYAVPVERIKELMADKGVVSEVSETTTDYHAGIRAFFAGDKEQALDLLTTVVEEQPGNELAADYLDQATDLPEPTKTAEAAKPAAAPAETGSGLNPTVLILGGLGGLILLLTAVLGVLAHRSRRSRQTPQASTTPHGAPQGAPPAWTPATTVDATSATGWATGAPTPTTTHHPVGHHHPVGFTTAAENTPLLMAPPTSYCPRCGSGAGPNSTFCSTCGSTLQP